MSESIINKNELKERKREWKVRLFGWDEKSIKKIKYLNWSG